MGATAPQKAMTGAELRAWAKVVGISGRSSMKVDQLRELHTLWMKTQRRARIRYISNETREEHYRRQCPGRGLSARQQRRIRKNKWRNEADDSRKNEGDTLGYLVPVEDFGRGAAPGLAIVDEVWNVSRSS